MMTDMFEHLNKYKIIFVTGPQRSGTRICAKMIERDLEAEYYDESVFLYDSTEHFINIINSCKKTSVIHCPGMCHWIHKVSKKSRAVVIMVRNIYDIIESQKRIGWNDNKELKKYKRQDSSGIISEIKYSFWLTHQKRLIHNPYEIFYKDLKLHEMWIDKKDRKNFAANQWKRDVDDRQS